jgi:hypothetical protein
MIAMRQSSPVSGHSRPDRPTSVSPGHRLAAALGSGFLGAAALTLLHETLRRVVPEAPRMDLLGERAIERAMCWAGYEPPEGRTLHQVALAGDLASNTAYYSLVGLGRPERAIARGAAIGLVAGVGALTLPGPLGLGTDPARRSVGTGLMTVGLYLGGGLVAGLAYRRLGSNRLPPKIPFLRSAPQ